MPLIQFCIFQYTGNHFYKDINRLLSEQNFISLKNCLCSIIRELPHYSQLAHTDTKVPVFRGVKKQFINLDEYKVGSKLYWTSFSSTSKNINVAKKFASNNGVIFEIFVGRNDPSHNIILPKGWSQYPCEEEILLFPNFYFEIVNIKEIDGFTFVQVQEVPYQNLLNLKKYSSLKFIWFDQKINNTENTKYQSYLIKLLDNVSFHDKFEEFMVELEHCD